MQQASIVQETFPAHPNSATQVRRAVKRGLAGLGLDEHVENDILLAVSEACINAIEHAYHQRVPQQFSVSALALDNEILFEIQDQGRWRSDKLDGRGHGLTIMSALSRKCEIEKSRTGTTIRLSFSRREDPDIGRG